MSSLGFVSEKMQIGVCPHFFIPSINLWGELVLGKNAETVPKQALLGCKIIQKLLKSDIGKIIIPDIFRCEILLKHIYSLPATQFYPRAILLLILAECLLVPSLPVLFLVIIVTIQTVVSWLLGMVTCLPVIIIYCILLVATRHIFT